MDTTMKIQIERLSYGMSNCYIVSQGGSAILIDASQAKYREKILKKCAGKNVKLIVLTHGHVDHAQNAAWLSEKLGVPVAMDPADIPLLQDALVLPVEADNLLGKLMAFAIRLGNHPRFGKAASLFMDSGIPPFEPIPLCDGFSFAEYGVDASVAALPGHTLGSVGVKAGSGDLIAGDALMHMLRPAKALQYQDRAMRDGSAKKISGMGDITIHFGHGKPVRNREWR